MSEEKETIINSECEFYNDCECDAYRHEYWEPQDNTKDMCKEHEDCYYKQLKRLQEENEGLKSLNDFNVQKIEVLKEENEKLYKALEEIRKKITPVCVYCNNIDGFTIWDDCENVCEKGVIKYLKIIDEVLK